MMCHPAALAAAADTRTTMSVGVLRLLLDDFALEAPSCASPSVVPVGAMDVVIVVPRMAIEKTLQQIGPAVLLT
jgi:hypothetical protein